MTRRRRRRRCCAAGLQLQAPLCPLTLMLPPWTLPPNIPEQVVGAHYQNEEAGFPTVVLCMLCCWEENILQARGMSAPQCCRPPTV